MFTQRLMIIAIGVALAFQTGCMQPGGATLTLFAASSLTDAFTEVAAGFEATQTGVTVALVFAGSPTLRTQIELGASADLFAPAAPEHVTRLVAAGLIAPATAVEYATNSLALVVPQQNPARVTAFSDLARPGVKLVLAAEEVPAGAYARTLLRNLDAHPEAPVDFSADTLANLVSAETNVRQVITKVILGEADAGIVYTSDITPDAAERVTVIPLPATYNISAQYTIAPLTDSPNPALSAAFIDYLLSADGRAILEKWGLQPVAR
jgi:molybdate transport system substrate-binding protein